MLMRIDTTFINKENSSEAVIWQTPRLQTGLGVTGERAFVVGFFSLLESLDASFEILLMKDMD